MKLVRRAQLAFIITVVLLILITKTVTLPFASSTAEQGILRNVTIINPYESVDWELFNQYKGNLHTHTTQSDGQLDPNVTIEEYHSLGYSILSITDHNMVTWPWEKYGKDPATFNMLAVKGNEISNTHHMGSYFIDYNSYSSDEERVLKEIGQLGGLAVLLHPGRYDMTVDWYANLYLRYDHLLGMEVINQGNRYKDDEKTWDMILARLMPQNPMWGFANDDMHRPAHIGRDFNVFLLFELTEGAFRDAMENGQFYFSSTATVRGPRGPAPVIKNINIDKNNSTISIDADHYKSIEWISYGKVIGRGETLDCTQSNAIRRYVRAVITGRGGKSFTQPFGIMDYD